MSFTELEIELEKQYIREERLGILCGAAMPTPEQQKIADEEAQQWEINARLEMLTEE